MTELMVVGIGSRRHVVMRRAGVLGVLVVCKPKRNSLKNQIEISTHIYWQPKLASSRSFAIFC